MAITGKFLELADPILRNPGSCRPGQNAAGNAPKHWSPTLLTWRAVTARSLGAALCGALLVCPLAATAAPFSPSASAPMVLAQASTASTAPAGTEPKPAENSPAVEKHIKELHDRLHITAAQQTQWDNLVQVMRDNAKAMMDLQSQRAHEAQEMTAVDAIKSYQQVIEAHEAGMNKFVPAFEALYNSMSDSQKKTADEMFRTRVRTAAAKETR